MKIQRCDECKEPVEDYIMIEQHISTRLGTGYKVFFICYECDKKTVKKN